MCIRDRVIGEFGGESVGAQQQAVPRGREQQPFVGGQVIRKATADRSGDDVACGHSARLRRGETCVVDQGLGLGVVDADLLEVVRAQPVGAGVADVEDQPAGHPPLLGQRYPRHGGPRLAASAGPQEVDRACLLYTSRCV